MSWYQSIRTIPERNNMQKVDSSVYVFNTHVEAEVAIRSLDQSGFDVKKLSLVGKGYHSEEHPVGFYTVGERIKSWGGTGAFWGSIWGLLLAPAVFFLPGLGLMALAAALTSIGISKDQIIKYEVALKADKYLLIVHGSEEDEAAVRAVLADTVTPL
jgi:Heat induced stress protein YflT